MLVEGEFPPVRAEIFILNKRKQRESLIELFKKFMLAYGKLRLCLGGLTPPFSKENRQSLTDLKAAP